MVTVVIQNSHVHSATSQVLTQALQHCINHDSQWLRRNGFSFLRWRKQILWREEKLNEKARVTKNSAVAFKKNRKPLRCVHALLSKMHHFGNSLQGRKFLKTIFTFITTYKQGKKKISWQLNHRPFPNCLVPLFQNESPWKIFLVKMSLICMKMHLWAELIFIWMVSHEDSFWHRGKQLGKGLF